MSLANGRCVRCGLPVEESSDFCPRCHASQVRETPGASPLPGDSDPAAAEADAGSKPGVSVVGILVAAAVAAAVAQHPKAPLLVPLAAVAMPPTLIHLLAFVALGVAWNRKIDEFGLFHGGRLLAFRVAGCLVRINWLPMGGYVKFHAMDETVAATPADDPYFERGYLRLRPWQKVVLNLSGPLAVLTLAVAALGPAAALREFVEGFVQHVEGALAPRTRGRELLAGYFRLLEQKQYTTALGVLAAKISAGNLLPVPTTNGGTALVELLAWVRGAPLRPRTAANLQVAGILVLFAFAVAWVIAVIAYARSG